MTFEEKEKQLFDYINKNYYINDNRFFNKNNSVQEWGCDLVRDLTSIFSFDKELCKDTLTLWALSNKLNEKELHKAWNSGKLKARWNPEMILDIQAQFGITNAEEELVALLSQEVAREIDSEILKEIGRTFKTSNAFLNIMRCEGYELGPQIINESTFTPYRNFISMNYNDIKNERQNNPHWQDWIRTRGQDQQA